MTWKPLPGRVIVTREQQLTSKVLHIIATDERGTKSADRGKVLAAGDPPKGAEPLSAGATVFYLGPEERLAIEWEGQKAYAVSYDEVLGVVEPDTCLACGVHPQETGGICGACDFEEGADG